MDESTAGERLDALFTELRKRHRLRNDGVRGGRHRVIVAVAVAESAETMRCLAAAADEEIDFILIGDPDRIREIAESTSTDISRFRIIGEPDEASACRTAARLVSSGEADTLMKGLAQTSTFTRAVLDKAFGLVAPGRLLSHVALFDIAAYHKLIVLTDSGINIDPVLEAKCAIVDNAIEIVRALGVDRPKVACIAPVEKVSEKIRSTIDAAAIRSLAETGRFGNAIVDGPMGLDIAVGSKAAALKGFSGPVAGDPDVLLLPGLDAANAVYKTLTVFAGADVAGVLTGARVPIILTSRSDTERTKLLSLRFAEVLAGGYASS